MEKSFDIIFDFPVAHSSLTVPLKAPVQLYHPDHYCVVDSFCIEKREWPSSHLSLSPKADIQCLNEGNKIAGVHLNFGRKPLLSLATGTAIEQAGYFSLR